jgi:hypothetical protein
MSHERDYRANHPLRQAIQDTYLDGLSDGHVLRLGKSLDNRRYAIARADVLEADLAACRAELATVKAELELARRQLKERLP